MEATERVEAVISQEQEMTREEFERIEIGEVFLLPAVEENSDKEEGRGHSYISSICLDQATAKEKAKGQGTFGSDAKTVLVEVIKTKNGLFQLGKKVEQLWPETEEDRIKKAKAKLTKEELEILGLV